MDNKEMQGAFIRSIQAASLQATIDVFKDKDKFLDAFFPGGSGEDELNAADVAIVVLSKLKTVEVMLATALTALLLRDPVEEGHDTASDIEMLQFFLDFARDIVPANMLLNEFIGEAELSRTYGKYADRAIEIYKASKNGPEKPMKASDLHKVASELKEFINKHKESLHKS